MIEVLESEPNLSHNAQFGTNTPVIKKKYFQEVFDKYNKVLKCDADLASDDNAGKASEEDQEQIEKEEKIFLE